MPKLRADLIANLDTVDGLQTALQNAIELEHATIPTYLYAMFSIKLPEDPKKDYTNKSIHDLIFSIVYEEMLHMGLACNILNAIGGSPVIDVRGFIPTYPGPLPGGVEEDLIVPLAPFSYDLVENVFMVIEEPEDPQNYPVKAAADALAPAPPHITIGEFYKELKRALCDAGPGIWVGDPSRQVSLPYMGLTEVKDYITAAAAIDLIVGQGEGTSKVTSEGTSEDPMEPGSEDAVPAHFYRFEEIIKKKKLIANPNPPPNPTPEQKYIYGGDDIPFDPDGVYPTIVNPSLHPYKENTDAWKANNTFNTTYSTLLKCLHTAFNGIPACVNDAINMMPDLTAQARVVMNIPLDDGSGKNAGPSFEYQAFAPNPCS